MQIFMNTRLRSLWTEAISSQVLTKVKGIQANHRSRGIPGARLRRVDVSGCG